MRYSRRELAVALGALGALVALQLLLTGYFADLIDEGYFADLADRVARGELPYRDFATPYTPGLHYLHAWAFGLIGRDLVTMRLLLVVVKSALAVLLYVLGRRLMPPAFAVLPVAMLFAIDTAPLMWEPHPAWYALLFALVCVWSVNRLIEGGSERWVLLAGAAAGLSFTFKQNIGLFILLAAGGWLLFWVPATKPALRSGRLPSLLASRLLWASLRVGYALAVLAALAWLLRAYLEPRVGTVLLLPVVVLAGAALARARLGLDDPEHLRRMLTSLVQLGGAFAVGGFFWALPLLVAIGPANLPLAQFTGSLDLTGFFWELAEPRLGFALLIFAAPICPLAVQRISRPNAFGRRLAEGAALFVLAALATDLAIADTALATPGPPQGEHSRWALSLRAAETVLIYLPSLAFWGAIAAGVTAARTLSPTARLALRWYLLAGALLLFNFYPRMDTMHVTFSAPLLFVVGSFALWRAFSGLTRAIAPTVGRPIYHGLLFGSLLVLPATAVLPNLEWRVGSTLTEDAAGLHFDPPNYVPLGVEGASVLVPAGTHYAVGGVARYLREHTPPGEPIFVYPTLPLFYYLADRPNPTRFGHVYPAAATPDEQRAMIAAIEASGTRYVVWDQYWVDEWGSGEKHLLNKPLTDYLLQRFRTETMIGPFHILVRSE